MMVEFVDYLDCLKRLENKILRIKIIFIVYRIVSFFELIIYLKKIIILDFG